MMRIGTQPGEPQRSSISHIAIERTAMVPRGAHARSRSRGPSRYGVREREALLVGEDGDPYPRGLFLRVTAVSARGGAGRVL